MSRALTREWLRHMRSGDFELAWQVSDAVLTARNNRRSTCCHLAQEALWRGEAFVDQRVLIRCCHGLGDTLQFIRYAPLVRRMARCVIVQGQAPLAELLQHVAGIDAIATLYDDVPRNSYDVAVEVMELPYAFRTQLGTIPARVPYIELPDCVRRRDSSLAVGVVWRAGEWDARRSVPCELIRTLELVPTVTLHLLQRDRQFTPRAQEFGIDASADDIVQLARTIAGLDLVISVDSMPAHLAGALGVPIWTLLHARCDWRWMSDREDSPWYPTMRLVRQSRARDWHAVIARVRSELARLADQFRVALAA